MTEPGRAEESTGGESAVGDSPEQQDTDTALAKSQGEAIKHAPSAEEQPAEPTDTEVVDTEAADTSAAQRRGGKKGLLVGLGSGALAGIVVGLAFVGFVKPDFLVGPGKPDGKASEVTAALASKNAGGLEQASCRSPDGKLSPQLPPEALQLIQSAKQSGPPHQSLDSEALTPVDLTLSAQGQTQTIPVDVVLGVTNGEWCMKGIAQRQQ
ncbi:hypothetical protein MOQ72_18945 [Saccharopolyspora sp. K220]|uniref:hypothetical protein n=1 Tax=Saccharopolyspora soli TaxID=2926618 RepID=UPI001F576344|nr:hypothetical protein [Saccharopolyspora soli]MCI2419525.1 hypothetical protein [Saccharopolyspora soli]